MIYCFMGPWDTIYRPGRGRVRAARSAGGRPCARGIAQNISRSRAQVSIARSQAASHAAVEFCAGSIVPGHRSIACKRTVCGLARQGVSFLRLNSSRAPNRPQRNRFSIDAIMNWITARARRGTLGLDCRCLNGAKTGSEAAPPSRCAVLVLLHHRLAREADQPSRILARACHPWLPPSGSRSFRHEAKKPRTSAICRPAIPARRRRP